MIRTATNSNGQVSGSVPSCTEGQVGQKMNRVFRMMVDYLNDQEWIGVTLRPDTLVTHVDISNPTKPALTLNCNGKEETLSFDDVVLNSGSPWKSLVSPELDNRVYSGIASHSAFQRFLARDDAIDPDGYLMPGLRIAIGGTSLSSYDAVALIANSAGLIELDKEAPLGWKLN